MKIITPSPDHDTLSDVRPEQHHSFLMPSLPDLGLHFYEAPGWQSAMLNTLTLTANRLYYFHIYVSSTRSYDRIGINVTTAGAAGTVARLGIYNSTINNDGDLEPGSLVVDAGTVGVNTTGTKSITIAETLTEGWYFLALSSDGAPTLSSYGSGLSQVALVTGRYTVPGGDMQGILRVDVADGAAALSDPATPPDGYNNTSSLAVLLRRS